jgi:hypothetical protein
MSYQSLAKLGVIGWKKKSRRHRSPHDCTSLGWKKKFDIYKMVEEKEKEMTLQKGQAIVGPATGKMMQVWPILGPLETY